MQSGTVGIGQHSAWWTTFLDSISCRRYIEVNNCVVHEVLVQNRHNSTRCRDGVKVLRCHSQLVGWFLRAPSLHTLVFAPKTFLFLFLL